MATAPQIVKIQGGTFIEDGHRYADEKGVDTPSVTQILESCGLSDYSRVPRDVLERKRQIGDASHFATRLYDEGDLDPFSVHELAAPYLECWMDLVEDVGIEIEPGWIEKALIHEVHGMKYAMTVDRLCRFTKSKIKHRIVLELKCALDEESSWRIQLAGYELAIPKAPGEYIARIGAQLRPKKKAKLYLYENPRDKDVFLQCLSITNWKINEKIAWRKS